MKPTHASFGRLEISLFLLDMVGHDTPCEATVAIKTAAQDSKSLRRDQSKEADKLCEISEETCRLARARQVSEADHYPIMQSCSSDGTPILISEFIYRCLAGAKASSKNGEG